MLGSVYCVRFLFIQPSLLRLKFHNLAHVRIFCLKADNINTGLTCRYKKPKLQFSRSIILKSSHEILNKFCIYLLLVATVGGGGEEGINYTWEVENINYTCLAFSLA
jgi:hypothetical protein